VEIAPEELLLNPSQVAAEDIQQFVHAVGWPFPTWIEQDLYDREFKSNDPYVVEERLGKMLQNLQTKIDKVFAAETVADCIEFKYWRKLKPQSKKEKPVVLIASLHQHPDYGNTWMYVEYD